MNTAGFGPRWLVPFICRNGGDRVISEPAAFILARSSSKVRLIDSARVASLKSQQSSMF